MKKFLWIILLTVTCAAQGPVTPNLGLQLSTPTTQADSLRTLFNNNMLKLDTVIGVRSYVGNGATAFGTGDVGSQINAACAAFSASGGEIDVLGGQAVTYNYTTPIVCSGGPVLIDLGGATLNYTPTTGVAVALNYHGISANAGYQPHGIRNGLIRNAGCIAGNGCGGYTRSSSAVGLLLGSATSAAVGPQISNLVISGFLQDIQLANVNNSMWGAVFSNVMLSSAGVGLGCASPGIYESLQMYAVRFTINLVGIQNSCNADIYMYGGSMDGNTTAISASGGHLAFNGVHFEDTNSKAGLKASISGGAVRFSNTLILDDNAAGNIATWFNCISGEIDWGSGNHYYSAGRTATNVFNISRGCTLNAISGLDNNSPRALSSIIGGTGTNNTFTLGGLVYSNGAILTGIAVRSLPPAASVPGAIRSVTDSTAISTEGQTCEGGSGTKALAFSNGLVWKCF